MTDLMGRMGAALQRAEADLNYAAHKLNSLRLYNEAKVLGALYGEYLRTERCVCAAPPPQPCGPHCNYPYTDCCGTTAACCRRGGEKWVGN